MATAVLVSTPNHVLRAGIRACLVEPNYRIAREVHFIEEVIESRLDSVDLIVAAEEPSPDFLKTVDEIRERYRQARIALYLQPAQNVTDDIAILLATKLDGIFSSEMTIAVLQKSVDLMMMGERVLPFAFAVSAVGRHGQSVAAVQLERADGPELSDRERQVLNLLRGGLSNKSIARQLALSEAAIKVHLRTLTHKIGAANRTQAALWGLKHEAFK